MAASPPPRPPDGRLHGQRYGRLGPDQVRSFLAALAEGRPYTPALRGVGPKAEAEQVARIGGFAWAAEHGLPARDVLIVGSTPESQESEPLARRWIAMTVGGIKLVADLARQSFRSLDACAAHGATLDPGHERWVLETIRSAR